MVVDTFTSRRSVVEADDKQRIVDELQTCGVCAVLCKCLAQLRPRLSVFCGENANGSTSDLDVDSS